MSTLTKPKIIAIGGAGIKIATRLVEGNLIHNEVLGIDLAQTTAPFEVINVGSDALGFLGSGGDPEVAARAFEGSKEKIAERLDSDDWYIILSGLGGGCATALTPLVSELIAKTKALAMAFVTMPFNIEGSRRVGQAREALERLRRACACVVPLPNEALLQNTDGPNNPEVAFAKSDTIIASALRGLGSINSYGSQLEIDPDLLRKTFSTKTKVKPLFLLGEVAGLAAKENLASELFNFPLLNSGSISRYADELLICMRSSDEFGLGDFDAIAKELSQKVGASKTRMVSARIEPEWENRLEVMLLGLYPIEPKKKTVNPIQKKRGKKGNDPKGSSQIELPFETVTLEKGYFDQCEPVYFRGEDIDAPTYLRRGIKLSS